MNEEQIERRVEFKMDKLDRAFMAGSMSQAEYDDAITELDKWASMESRRARNAPFKEDFLNYA